MRAISTAEQKVGVGKTTTAHNLSAELADKRHDNLLFELDQRQNAVYPRAGEKDTVNKGELTA